MTVYVRMFLPYDVIDALCTIFLLTLEQRHRPTWRGTIGVEDWPNRRAEPITALVENLERVGSFRDGVTH
jgi:predicted RNA-binding protein Jag